MRDITNLEKSDTLKIHLSITINFVSSKYVEIEHVMHSKSNNIEFIPYDMQINLLKNFSSHYFQETKLV